MTPLEVLNICILTEKNAVELALPEILRFVGFPTEIAAQMRQVVYGIILILLMLYRPRGLMGEYKL